MVLLAIVNGNCQIGIEKCLRTVSVLLSASAWKGRGGCKRPGLSALK
jgi:hypothetical protein